MFLFNSWNDERTVTNKSKTYFYVTLALCDFVLVLNTLVRK